MAQYDYSDSDDSEHIQGVQCLPFQSSNRSSKVLLLHGNLEIVVKGAFNLPNMKKLYNRPRNRRCCNFMIEMTDVEARNCRKGTTNPYVRVSVCDAIIGRTFIVHNNENPVWMQQFNVLVAHYAAEVCFSVKHSSFAGSQFIGAVGIPVEQLWSGEKLEGSFPVLNKKGKQYDPGVHLTLSIQYMPVEKMNHSLLEPDGEYKGVHNAYFPLRKSGNVTLYQDAHCPAGCLPHDMRHEHGKCWLDLFHSISQAKHFIYITGWSLYHRIQLVRDDNNAESILGNLLKTKSNEGVTVLILLWDDVSAQINFSSHLKDGIMHTHAKETQKFFKDSSVHVLLSRRSSAKGDSFKQEKETYIYSHHQKTVVMDADAGQHKRKVIAFVGGLDLCGGRYDTPEHPLFRTLETVHKEDYYNPNFNGDPLLIGPRQPWHDLHCQIDGLAAHDVITNFEERWLRTSAYYESKRKLGNAEKLFKIDECVDIIKPNDDLPRHETWHVQVFRSIDSRSVERFPSEPKDAIKKNLICGKNVIVDTSMHTAYVKAIRGAQRFIYIENQYFLGSSYNWSEYQNIGANNLIPMEIALKIANKIRAKERFSTYILIPMWPEGDPTSMPTRRILRWQYNTMKMMYKIIYEALKEVGLENKYEPQDYLNFFCLGNREAQAAKLSSQMHYSKKRKRNIPQVLAQKNRRFMVYVHAKAIIVDDEYLICGSANINQRSLEGTRDTEIAVGAYQPHHTWASNNCSPHGQIHQYRMSLWAEHIGSLEDCFKQPDSLECVKRVRSISETNWRQYAAKEVTQMKGHLLKYPLEVDRGGEVKPLPGCEEFPDIGGKIVGSSSHRKYRENLTT